MEFGVFSSKTDLRDHKVKPVKFSKCAEFMLGNLPPVKYQGQVCSCVAHAASSILEWHDRLNGINAPLSTGFLYGMQGKVFNRKFPAMCLRDVCKIAQKYGDCLYSSVSFNVELPEGYNLLKPLLDENLYKEAATRRISSYAKCKNKNAVKNALVSFGPVIMAVKWHKEYTVDSNGIIHFDTSSNHGQHAVMVYGFNQIGWLCQNSYGADWGNKGRFVLPYKYGFKEAWVFIKYSNGDVFTPKHTPFLDHIYRFLNSIINTFYC